MKKILSLVSILAFSISSYAVSITRTSAPLEGVGVSMVSVCGPSTCTALSSLPVGNTFSSFVLSLTSIVVTFDYAMYPETPTVFNVTPGALTPFPGTYFTYYEDVTF